MLNNPYQKSLKSFGEEIPFPNPQEINQILKFEKIMEDVDAEYKRREGLKNPQECYFPRPPCHQNI